MKSTLINMVMVLCGITLVAAAGVGAVKMVTDEPIAIAEKNSADMLVKQVLPEGAEVMPADTVFNVDGNVVTVAKGMIDGAISGYAVSAPSLTVDGFNGKVTLMVGFTPAGDIFEIEVLKQNETPGLGTLMAIDGNKTTESFFTKSADGVRVGKNPSKMKLAVTKDGGEVDALTAATISSRAYVNAVATAYAGFLKVSAEDQKSSEAQKGGENE